MTSNTSLLAASVLLVVLLAVYGYITVSGYEAHMAEPESVNPASAYCIENGGSIEIRESASGVQTNFCRLPDGRICEEQPLFDSGACVVAA